MAKIKQLDTTTTSLREKYLQPTAEWLAQNSEDKSKRNFYASEVLKLAFIRFAADAADLKGEERNEFFKLLNATPMWFPTNSSACRQHFEKKGGVAAIEANYAGL